MNRMPEHLEVLVFTIPFGPSIQLSWSKRFKSTHTHKSHLGFQYGKHTEVPILCNKERNKEQEGRGDSEKNQEELVFATSQALQAPTRHLQELSFVLVSYQDLKK